MTRRVFRKNCLSAQILPLVRQHLTNEEICARLPNGKPASIMAIASRLRCSMGWKQSTGTDLKALRLNQPVRDYLVLEAARRGVTRNYLVGQLLQVISNDGYLLDAILDGDLPVRVAPLKK